MECEFVIILAHQVLK